MKYNKTPKTPDPINDKKVLKMLKSFPSYFTPGYFREKLEFHELDMPSIGSVAFLLGHGYVRYRNGYRHISHQVGKLKDESR